MTEPHNASATEAKAGREEDDEWWSVCEARDLVAAGLAHWDNPADEPCHGSETWLLVGGVPGDVPSPLCPKHAQMLQERIGDLFAELGQRLVRA